MLSKFTLQLLRFFLANPNITLSFTPDLRSEFYSFVCLIFSRPDSYLHIYFFYFIYILFFVVLANPSCVYKMVLLSIEFLYFLNPFVYLLIKYALSILILLVLFS